MTTWVLLRGLTRESRHWGDFPESFRQADPGARVLTIDFPGNGALHRSASSSDVREMAGHCRAELARRGVAPPYDVLAMSLGAMVAVAWAHAYPPEVRRCVLINTSLRPFSPYYRRLRPRNYLSLLKLAVFGGSSAEWEARIFSATSRLRADKLEVLKDWIAFRDEYPVTRKNAWRQLCAAARYRSPAAKPAASLLLLASRNDALVDARCSQALAGAWNCPIRVHPRAGHDLPLDDPRWVIEQVRNWIGTGDRG